MTYKKEKKNKEIKTERGNVKTIRNKKKNNKEEGEIKNKIMKEFESVYFINLSILFIGIEKY